MSRRIGAQTLALDNPPSLLEGASVAGRREGEGPLRRSFDYISQDPYFGEASWEQAESAMLRQCFDLACDKAAEPRRSLDLSLPATCSTSARARPTR